MEKIKDLVTKNTYFTYQEDSGVELFGYYIYGTPWTKSTSNSGFQVPDYTLAEIFSRIPEKTDILVSHGPAYKILDYEKNKYYGSKILLDEIFDRVKPMFHLFGHIHYSNGIQVSENTYFVNSAVCDEDYNPTGKIYFFDLPILSNR